MVRHKQKDENFFARHSLSLISIAILTSWILLYRIADEHSHPGSFFGNAIADWSGVVVVVIATKFLEEKGSAESREHGFFSFAGRHSLSIFLLLTGAAWLFLYSRMDPTSKWGEVVGNTLSEWGQLFGLVMLTKVFREPGSKEDKG